MSSSQRPLLFNLKVAQIHRPGVRRPCTGRNAPSPASRHSMAWTRAPTLIARNFQSLHRTPQRLPATFVQPFGSPARAGDGPD